MVHVVNVTSEWQCHHFLLNIVVTHSICKRLLVTTVQGIRATHCRSCSLTLELGCWLWPHWPLWWVWLNDIFISDLFKINWLKSALYMHSLFWACDMVRLLPCCCHLSYSPKAQSALYTRQLYLYIQTGSIRIVCSHRNNWDNAACCIFIVLQDYTLFHFVLFLLTI